MDEDTQRIAKEVARRFPEMFEVEPSISALPNSNKLYTFKKTLVTEDGSQLPRVVNATVDSQGNLIKISTSRG